MTERDEAEQRALGSIAGVWFWHMVGIKDVDINRTESLSQTYFINILFELER